MRERRIPWILYAKDRDICEFYFTVSNKPGMLSKVLKLFMDYNINILSISASASPDDERAPIFIFADLTDMDIDLEEFKRVIEERSGDEVLIKYPVVKGFMLDEFSFPLNALPGVRSIIFLGSDLTEMFRGLYDKFGDLAAVYLYHMAYPGGRYMAEYLTEKLYPVGGGS